VEFLRCSRTDIPLPKQIKAQVFPSAFPITALAMSGEECRMSLSMCMVENKTILQVTGWHPSEIDREIF
jgi:hypothetical protein